MTYRTTPTPKTPRGYLRRLTARSQQGQLDQERLEAYLEPVAKDLYRPRAFTVGERGEIFAYFLKLEALRPD